MSLPHAVPSLPAYATYRPRRHNGITEAIDGLVAFLARCRADGTTHALADARLLDTLPDLTTFDRFQLGTRAAEAAAGWIKLALVAPERLIDPDRFGQVVAQNRGLQVKVFAEEVGALEWLVGPDAIRPVLETERLALRWLTTQDAGFIQELVNQPSWLANIGERNVRSREDGLGYIVNGPRASYAKHGFGLWCVVRKEDGIPIGLCGLLQRDYLEHPDIGFAYLERFQGMGYGMEAARATWEYARAEFGTPRLMATVVPGNAGSIRILEKLGLVSLGPFKAPGDETALILYGTEAPSPSP